MARCAVLARMLVGLAVAASACTGGGHATSAGPGRPGVASWGADPTPEPAWRDYVPARCRDAQGPATPRCRTRRIVTTSTSIELLDAVVFTGDTAALSPAAYRTLDQVVQTLIANPSLRVIEVRGHGGARLPAIQRAALAQQRAEVVAAYLVARGVATSRVAARGVTDEDRRDPSLDPALDPSLDPPDDARGRRVEFVILERDE